MLANNSQHCWMPLPAACCCVLLKVVAQNLKLVKLLSQQLLTFPLFRDHRSVAQQCSIRCTALPTLLGPLTCITYALQSLMGFILHTMHCSSQHCWDLLHPFVHHYQHGRNSSPTMLGVVASLSFSFSNTKTRNSQLLRQFRYSLNYENVFTKYPIPGSPWSNQPGKYPQSKD